MAKHSASLWWRWSLYNHWKAQEIDAQKRGNNIEKERKVNCMLEITSTGKAKIALIGDFCQYFLLK